MINFLSGCFLKFNIISFSVVSAISLKASGAIAHRSFCSVAIQGSQLTIIERCWYSAACCWGGSSIGWWERAHLSYSIFNKHLRLMTLSGPWSSKSTGDGPRWQRHLRAFLKVSFGHLVMTSCYGQGTFQFKITRSGWYSIFLRVAYSSWFKILK